MDLSTIANVANAGLFTPSDLSSLAVSAPSLSLLETPGLPQSLAAWDGGMTPGSQRTPAATATPAAEAKTLTYRSTRSIRSRGGPTRRRRARTSTLPRSAPASAWQSCQFARFRITFPSRRDHGGSWNARQRNA
jgi:hypothetical protein